MQLVTHGPRLFPFLLALLVITAAHKHPFCLIPLHGRRRRTATTKKPLSLLLKHLDLEMVQLNA